MAKILLLDGNSLAYRAFFALPTDLATASGQVTNAVFGFTSMLINLLKDHKPDGIGIAFDRPERTFRHDLVPDYKAGRAEAPDILRQQMGLVRQVVETLRIPIVDAPGYEADDVIATLATQAKEREHEARVRQNAQATPLVRDVPLEVGLDDLRMGQWDADEVRDLFGFLEFRTLWDRLLEAVGGQAPAPATTETLDVDVTVVRQPGDAVTLFEKLGAGNGPVAAAGAWEGVEGRSALAGLALAGDGAVWWVDAGLLADSPVALALGRLLGPGGPPLAAHRAKELMRGLDRFGVDVQSLDLDTAVAAYLLDPAESQYLLEELAARYAGLELRSPDAPASGQLDLDGSASPADDAGRRAAAVARLAPALRQALQARRLETLYEDVERPLIRVLARMEKVGVRVDVG